MQGRWTSGIGGGGLNDFPIPVVAVYSYDSFGFRSLLRLAIYTTSSSSSSRHRTTLHWAIITLFAVYIYLKSKHDLNRIEFQKRREGKGRKAKPS